MKNQTYERDGEMPWGEVDRGPVSLPASGNWSGGGEGE
jgi:hypothetical protein